MKRIVSLFVCLGILALFLPSTSQAQMKFGFKAYGGLNMLNGGDLNAGAEGWFDFWDFITTAYGYSTDGEFAAAKLGMNFGGEFLLMFNPNMGVGLGVGMLSASKSSLMTATAGSYVLDFDHTVKASAIPIRLSFYYFMPAGANMNVFFNAGAGYYLAKANYTYVLTNSSTETTEYDMSGGGLGFHGGLGLEYALSPMFGIVAELQGRFASFAGFEGEQRNGTTYSGTLYYFEGDLGTSTFPLITIDDTMPSGSGVSNAREAKVDFSGFSFVVGFFVRF
ncbi:MAG: hypothetical protein JW747_08160 [Candidatus Aminicenantes bacterium]|nr:hypothetical protein [Candidatus Aminicenantes bacterium]